MTATRTTFVRVQKCSGGVSERVACVGVSGASGLLGGAVRGGVSERLKGGIGTDRNNRGSRF